MLKKSIIAATLALAGLSHVHASDGLKGLSLSIDTQQWYWQELQEDGAEYLNEKGAGVLGLGAEYRWDDGFGLRHGLGLSVSGGDITYNGSYINGPKLRSTTDYSTWRLQYDISGPLSHVSPSFGPARWSVALAYEERQRDIWNPSREGFQQEDYSNGLIKLGLEWPRQNEGLYGSVGLTRTFSNRMNPHGTEIGFKENPVLKPGARTGMYLEAGYAFDRNWALEAGYERTGIRISNKAPVTGADDQQYLIWQPQAKLERTYIRARYSF
jgi:hypothetical protein